MGRECSPYGFYARGSPGISTSHLLTLGLHLSWLAGLMPCCCGFLPYITYSKEIKEPVVLGFENFQRIKAVL
jgi:hypothetical protein